MLTLKGKSVFSGISIGPLALFHRNIGQLKDLYVKAVDKVGEEQAAVFEVHQMMLDDDDYVEGIETKIRDEKMNAEAAVDQTAQEFAEMFRSMEDAYMQARAADVLDISRRVEQQLWHRFQQL